MLMLYIFSSFPLIATPVSAKSSTMRRQTSCHGMVRRKSYFSLIMSSPLYASPAQFAKLEESFKASGLQGATEFVRQVSAQQVCRGDAWQWERSGWSLFLFSLQPQLGLIHEACLCGVEVSTLDLLLDVLSEKNLDINSKTEVRHWHLHKLNLLCLIFSLSPFFSSLCSVVRRHFTWRVQA